MSSDLAALCNHPKVSRVHGRKYKRPWPRRMGTLEPQASSPTNTSPEQRASSFLASLCIQAGGFSARFQRQFQSLALSAAEAGNFTISVRALPVQSSLILCLGQYTLQAQLTSMMTNSCLGIVNCQVFFALAAMLIEKIAAAADQACNAARAGGFLLHPIEGFCLKHDYSDSYRQAAERYD